MEHTDAERAWDELVGRARARLHPEEQAASAGHRFLFPDRGRPPRRPEPDRPSTPSEPLTNAQRQAQLRLRQRLLDLVVTTAGYRSSEHLAAALLREPANLSRLRGVPALAKNAALLTAIHEGRLTAGQVSPIVEDVLRAAYRRWALPSQPEQSAVWNAFTPLGSSVTGVSGSPGHHAILIVQAVDQKGMPLPPATEPDDFGYIAESHATSFGSTGFGRRVEAWGFLATFPDARAARAAARHMREALTAMAPAVHARMAIHSGALTSSLGGFPSRDLYVAEALLLLAGPGQVFVTAAGREALGAPADLLHHGRRMFPLLEEQDVYELDAPAAAVLDQASLSIVLARASKIPFPLPDLVGDAVTSVRERAPVVTFLGPGGAGATRVALQTAVALSREYASVQFVDLAAVVDRTRVVRFVAEALQVSTQGPSPDARESVTGSLQRFFRELGPALLVLDSCDRALVECSGLVRELLQGCRELTVLATASEPLGLPGEKSVTVRPLSLPARRDGRVGRVDVDSSEAGRLFISTAQRVEGVRALTEDDAEAVTRLCELVQGLPVAIELLAATTASQPDSLADQAGDLNEYLNEQTGVPAPALPRDRLLNLAISWCLRALEAQSTELVRHVLLLSLFPADFDEEAAREVCGTDDAARFRAELDAIVSRGFVQLVDDGDVGVRYRVPESIRLECEAVRRYDRDLARAVQEASARFVEHFAARLTRTIDRVYGPDQMRWIEVLKREIPNFRTALLRSWQGGAGSRSAATIAGEYARLLLQVGHAAEAADVVDDGLRRWPTPDETRLRLLSQAGLVDWRRGSPADAKKRWLECLELATALGDLNEQARALDRLAMVALGYGQLDRARELCEEGLEIANRLDDPSRRSFGEFNLGLIALRSGDLAAGRRHLQLSLDIRRGNHPNPLRVATSLLGLAELAVAEFERGQGDLAAGRQHLREALDIYAGGHDRLSVAMALSLCVVLLAAQRDWEDAIRLHAAAERIAGQMGQGMPAVWAPAVQRAQEHARRELPPQVGDLAAGQGRKLDDLSAVAYAQELLAAPDLAGPGDTESRMRSTEET